MFESISSAFNYDRHGIFFNFEIFITILSCLFLFRTRFATQNTDILIIFNYIDEDQRIQSRAKKPSRVGNHVFVEATLGIVGLSVIALAIIGSVVIRCSLENCAMNVNSGSHNGVCISSTV
jgi:hypothetical protein